MAKFLKGFFIFSFSVFFSFATFFIHVASISIVKASNGTAFTLSGTYIGDGTSSRAITGLGFQPDVVMIKTGNATAAQTVIRTSTMNGAVEMAIFPATGLISNTILSLDVGGFSVGSDVRVNSNNVNYYWTAFKSAPGELVVGTYPGDGSSDHAIPLNFAPDYVMIIRDDGTTPPKQRSKTMSWGQSFFSENVNFTRITALDNIADNGFDGFTVGNSTSTNQAPINSVDVIYNYVAWKNIAGRMSTGTYLGDSTSSRDITGLGFQPESVWIIPETSNIASTWRPSSLSGDNTLSFNIFATVNNQIKLLIADGFRIGSHPRVNQGPNQGNPAVNYNWIAWAKNIPPTVIPLSLPNGTVAMNYSQNLTATGGSGSYGSWTVNSGSLPSGLNLDSVTGIVSGMPSASGIFNFSVTTTDSEGAISLPVNFSITVVDNAVLNVSTSSLPSATVNLNYIQNLTANGGSGSYASWSLASGSLPNGLNLNSATGVIAGAPTATGTSNFSVTVTDSNSATSAPVNLSIAVNLPPSIIASSLPPAAVSSLYSQALTATAGSGTYSSWVVSSGSLPNGLSLNSMTGVISGTPTATGTSNFSVTVSDSNAVTSPAVNFSIEVYASMTAMFEQLNSASTNYNSSVIILVDPSVLSSNLIGSFSTWVQDLRNDAYRPIVKVSTFSTPEEVRTYLQQQGASVLPHLEGVVLVGNIPYAHLVIDETSIPGGTIVSVPTYEFYQDMDGNFTKADPNFPDAYSTHTGSTTNEIWVSVLPFYQDPNTTVQNIVYYLGKNHTYRTQGTVAKSYVEIKDMSNVQTIDDYNLLLNQMLSGLYSWIPGNSVFQSMDFFINNSVGQPGLPAGYAALAQPNKYAAFALNTHGDSFTAGWLSKNWFDNNTLNPLFAFLTGCSSGNPDAVTPPVLSELIYNSHSNALVAQGTTALSGGLGTNVDGFYGKNILRALFNGQNVGEALRSHLNAPLISPWDQLPEYQHALLILDGDATLRFPIRASAVAVSTSKTPTIFNESVTFTATVTGANPVPTGTVTFKDGLNVLGTVALDGTGHAQYQISTLAVATHPITASYSGDAVYHSSASSSVDQVVYQKAIPMVSPLAYPNPSQVNKSVTFYAVVTGSYGNPTGTVNFYDGATYLGVRTLNANGQAAFSISTLSVGNHSITIKYNGNATYSVLTSAPLVQVVQ